MSLSTFHCRTLATDKGFKERVQEDMLVRLLDAFVWRSNGMQNCKYFICNDLKFHNNYQTGARMIWALHTFKE